MIVLALVCAAFAQPSGPVENAFAAGDYQRAIELARESLARHQRSNSLDGQATDWNAIGRASTYLGRFPEAIAAYQSALAIDRQQNNAEGEVVRLYNLGNVHFELGRYQDSFRHYQAALDRIDAAGNQPWTPRRRQVAAANLAILHQRVGSYGKALELYRGLALPASMPASERAQLLANQGTLYRRLGDPVKALEIYRQAQALFARDSHPFGEVGVLKNIGILYALDLDRLPDALEAFGAARRVAETSAKAQVVPIRLYVAETLLALGRRDEAAAEFAIALDGARRMGSAEYDWRAMFGLGRIAAQKGDTAEALRLYSEAIARFESVRSGLDMAVLKRDFLADKRQVYDAAIALLVKQPSPPLDRIYRLMENSRSRILQDSFGSRPGAGLKVIQGRLDHGTALMELWSGPDSIAVLYVTRSGVDLRVFPAIDVAGFRKAILDTGGWTGPASRIGAMLLSGLPSSLTNLIVVPDGALALIPFELLALPGESNTLLIERTAVSYAPSAGVLLRQDWGRGRGWSPPWRNHLLAFADPAADPATPGLFDAPLATAARLPKSVEEVRYIAGLAAGRNEVRTGADARKYFLTAGLGRGFPLLHLATHAIADYTDPERSRILMAPAALRETSDFLFLRELYSMDLKALDLVVLSACDTETGKLIRGEGVEGFAKAFIAAGASSIVTTLWRVDDDATSQFMKQFYYHLEGGAPKAEALRQAKLKFLRSGSELSHPRHWAAFVLNGDGLAPAPRFFSWWWMLAPLAVLTAIAIKARSSRSRPESTGSRR